MAPKSRRKDDDFSLASAKVNTSPSTERRAVYFLLALLVSAVPVYLYYAIFDLSIESFGFVYAIVTLGSAVALTFAYHNVALFLKARLALRRDSEPRRKTDDKKKKSKHGESQDEIDLDREATSFAVLYNDLFFLFAVIVFAFYVFRAAQPAYNFALSVGGSAALVTFISQATTTNTYY
eukprot:TRINITY_DN1533_c0_g1_i1.p1 TRINITY_DN1533_c0_g1~~TRINITY_DN1533_c0_g1_i1.p1  ORF type:complete len:179 (-),score=45.93 TRINITY_DN1533_c0_g1_i1:83-619(-)